MLFRSLAFGVYGGKAKATGKFAQSDWMFRWKVVDGKITKYESYIDTAAMLAAMS